MRHSTLALTAVLTLSTCISLSQSGCGGGLRELEVTPPPQLCRDASLGEDAFCMPAGRLELLLESKPFELRVVEETDAGTSGAQRWQVAFETDGPQDPLVMLLKWKAAPHGGTGVNNSPRKEIAAYEMQKLFLSPDAYVVPPTVGRCVPLTRYRRRIDGDAEPTFEGTECVFGTMTYWLQNVGPLEEQLREQEWNEDAAYRHAVASLNLFTYLADHRDSRDANFLRSTDPSNPRLFSIDNGLAFSGIVNPIYIVKDWREFHVPALAKSHVERLRRLTRADLERLGVVAEFELEVVEYDGDAAIEPEDENDRDDDALEDEREDDEEEDVVMLVPSAPGVNLRPDQGVRFNGKRLQLGLTRSEIDDIETRINILLQRVDRGDIRVF